MLALIGDAAGLLLGLLSWNLLAASMSSLLPRAKRDDGGPSVQSSGNSNIKPEEPVEVIGIAANPRAELFEKEPRSAIYFPFARAFSRTHISSSGSHH